MMMALLLKSLLEYIKTYPWSPLIFFKVFNKEQEAAEVQWLPAVIHGYDNKKEKFRCALENGNRRLIPRILVCFDIEDPN